MNDSVLFLPFGREESGDHMVVLDGRIKDGSPFQNTCYVIE